MPSTDVDTLERALETIGDTGWGVVLDADTVVDLGDRLGSVRVSARALESRSGPVAGLLGTLPPHIAAVIGAPEGVGAIDIDHVARVTALRATVDTMLRLRQRRSMQLSPWLELLASESAASAGE
ncbi:hypothetical protein [Pseudonocardia nigra]|uniref:hypothetical protein n=1 Tax=Pseudonocardia nigra TaxID=1921578 RepID=UPI001C5CD5F6|nr:hypothetical protein [Pseudonocardia nigra]